MSYSRIFSQIVTFTFKVLCGHDKTVSCVALSVDLDTAVSGSEDGTVNVYTVKVKIGLIFKATFVDPRRQEINFRMEFTCGP
jgi:hypothetical protein